LKDPRLRFVENSFMMGPLLVCARETPFVAGIINPGSESNIHGSNPHQLELLKMGRCKDLAYGSESWVDEESKRRYETMTQLMAPSSDVDAESHTPATPDEAFISIMGKDRPGRVRCAGSGEMLSTWYEKIIQEQLKAQEEKMKAQAEDMTQM
ncbi:hypothetical protein Taro_022117, partial [Colocasia esculenta]|nr:hypothetical protein [Colocasia esculenta]